MASNTDKSVLIKDGYQYEFHDRVKDDGWDCSKRKKCPVKFKATIHEEYKDTDEMNASGVDDKGHGEGAQ